ncbi:MAG: DUF378 domain-containing protein [Patescibacteria group bacterium]
MMNSSWCVVHKIAWVLVFIGAINWGLIGFFDLNLVHAILGGIGLGASNTPERVVYALVGLAALFSCTCGMCKMCKGGKK